MYAIVEIAGQQFKVETGKKIFVHRLEAEEGKEIKFDQVLLIEEDGKITIGEPTIKDAYVDGLVVEHPRGDKVIVFKKKRKKGYRIKNGHRQNLTQVEVLTINGKGALVKKSAPKKAEKVTEEAVEEAPVKGKKTTSKKAAAVKEETPDKKTAVKKAAEKKPAEKKPAAKKSTKTKE
jgi:large subunit ribosomal protein L21